MRFAATLKIWPGDHLENKEDAVAQATIHASQQPDHGCCRHLQCTGRDCRNILHTTILIIPLPSPLPIIIEHSGAGASALELAEDGGKTIARPDTGVLVITEYSSARDDRFLCLVGIPRRVWLHPQRGSLARLVAGAWPGWHSSKAGYG